LSEIVLTLVCEKGNGKRQGKDSYGKYFFHVIHPFVKCLTFAGFKPVFDNSEMHSRKEIRR